MNTFFTRLFRLVFPHKDAQTVKRQYRLPENLNLTIRLSADGWFVVTSPELPGLVTEARNQQELIEMVNDAVLTYFNVPKRDADIVYDRFEMGSQVLEYKGQLKTRPA